MHAAASRPTLRSAPGHASDAEKSFKMNAFGWDRTSRKQPPPFAASRKALASAACAEGAKKTNRLFAPIAGWHMFALRGEVCGEALEREGVTWLRTAIQDRNSSRATASLGS